MSAIMVPTRGPEDWRALLAEPDRQWREGYSAMCVALSWERAGGLPREVAAVLGPGAEALLAIPEHKVALPGRGYHSQCDVFALVRVAGQTVALTVEAKVREPFDRTLAEWLGPAPSDGKRARLAGICALLGRDAPPMDLRYQLLHRTAAAVIEAERFGLAGAAMIVQSFDPGHAWFDDYAGRGRQGRGAAAAGRARSDGGLGEQSGAGGIVRLTPPPGPASARRAVPGSARLASAVRRGCPLR